MLWEADVLVFVNSANFWVVKFELPFVQATMLLWHPICSGSEQVWPFRGEDQPCAPLKLWVVQWFLPSSDTPQQPVAGAAGVLLRGHEVQGSLRGEHWPEALRVAGARPRPAHRRRGLQVHPGGAPVGGRARRRRVLPWGVLLQHHGAQLVPAHHCGRVTDVAVVNLQGNFTSNCIVFV